MVAPLLNTSLLVIHWSGRTSIKPNSFGRLRYRSACLEKKANCVQNGVVIRDNITLVLCLFLLLKRNAWYEIASVMMCILVSVCKTRRVAFISTQGLFSNTGSLLKLWMLWNIYFGWTKEDSGASGPCCGC